MRKWLVAYILFSFVVVFAAVGHCDPVPPDDVRAQVAAETHLDVESGAEGWLYATSTWSPGAVRKDLVGGRLNALVGFGHYGLGVRAETIGLPGSFDRNKPETFQAAALYVAIHRNVLAVDGGPGSGWLQVGVGAVGGLAVPLVFQNGVAPSLVGAPFTAGVGVRASAPGWWMYGIVGRYQGLKGPALMLTAHVRMSDRMAWVGDFAVGGGPTYVATLGVAVRTF